MYSIKGYIEWRARVSVASISHLLPSLAPCLKMSFQIIDCLVLLYHCPKISNLALQLIFSVLTHFSLKYASEIHE